MMWLCGKPESNPLDITNWISHCSSRQLKHILERLNIQSWLGPRAFLAVEKVQGVRDWKGWTLGCKQAGPWAIEAEGM